MRAEVSEVFERPPSMVFRFTVTDHLRNHPRWDPQMELWPTNDGPVGLGTVFRRRQSRGDTAVDGTMEIVEFGQDRLVGWLVTEGSFVARSWATYEALDGGRTRLTIGLELPELIKTFDPSFVQRSLRNMKTLIETETEPGPKGSGWAAVRRRPSRGQAGPAPSRRPRCLSPGGRLAGRNDRAGSLPAP